MKSTLVKIIKNAAQSYYEGEPTMSDEEFDETVELLRREHPDHPLLQTPGWGYVPANHLTKIPHLFHVGSLPKIRQADFLKGKRIPYSKFTCSLKLDGGSAVAYYKDGKLLHVLSRGDGTVGLDITYNMLQGQGVPKSIDCNDIIAVRGEVILTLDDFAQVGGSCPRNVAVGLSQSKTVDPESVKYLTFVACSVAMYADVKYSSYLWQDLDYLASLGFLTVPHSVMSKNLFAEEVKLGTRIGALNKLLDSGSMKGLLPIDGLVLADSKFRKPNDDGVFINDSIAFKFEDVTAKTTVKDIEWNVSRTGRLIPVALIETTRLSGAEIKRVTMNNTTFLQENRSGVGARIEIVRSNMIIPKLVRTLLPIEPAIPTHCPSCGMSLEKDGRDLVCCNGIACPAQNREGLRRFWNMVKPDNVGPALLFRLEQDFKLYSVQSICDWAKKFDRKDFDGYGMKTLELVTQMARSILAFRPTVAQILILANIPKVGKSVAFGFQYGVSVEKFVTGVTKSGGLPAYWEKLAQTKTTWSNLQGSQRTLKGLVQIFDLDTTEPLEDVKVTVCLTGALSRPRSKVLERWAKVGVREASASTCDVLIADSPSDSSKYQKALQRGIPILTESEFVKNYRLTQ